MLTVGLLSIFGCGIILWLGVSHRRRVMGDPPQWPAKLTRAALTRYARFYLKSSGWQILPAWLYDDVNVRASKGGSELNVFVLEDSVFSLSSAIAETTRKSIQRQVVIGVLTQQKIPGVLRQDAAQSGIFVINPCDLVNIDAVLQLVVAKKAVLS